MDMKRKNPFYVSTLRVLSFVQQKNRISLTHPPVKMSFWIMHNIPSENIILYYNIPSGNIIWNIIFPVWEYNLVWEYYNSKWSGYFPPTPHLSAHFQVWQLPSSYKSFLCGIFRIRIKRKHIQQGKLSHTQIFRLHWLDTLLQIIWLDIFLQNFWFDSFL